MMSYNKPMNEGNSRKNMENNFKRLNQSGFGIFESSELVSIKIEAGIAFESFLRISSKNFSEAYVSTKDGGSDIFIKGVPDRNSALDGDLVIVEIKPESEWKILEEEFLKYIEDHKSVKKEICRATSYELIEEYIQLDIMFKTDSNSHKPNIENDSKTNILLNSQNSSNIPLIITKDDSINIESSSKKFASPVPKIEEKSIIQLTSDMQNVSINEARAGSPNQPCNSAKHLKKSDEHIEESDPVKKRDKYIVAKLSDQSENLQSGNEGTESVKSKAKKRSKGKKKRNKCINQIIASKTDSNLVPNIENQCKLDSHEQFKDTERMGEINSPYISEKNIICSNNEPSTKGRLECNKVIPEPPVHSEACNEISNITHDDLLEQEASNIESRVIEKFDEFINAHRDVMALVENKCMEEGINIPNIDVSSDISLAKEHFKSMLPDIIEKKLAYKNMATIQNQEHSNLLNDGKNERIINTSETRTENRTSTMEAESNYKTKKNENSDKNSSKDNNEEHEAVQRRQELNNYNRRKAEIDQILISLLLDMPELWPFVQKTGRVIYITQYNHPRTAVGKVKKGKASPYFSPLDSRVPRMMLDQQTLPDDYISNPLNYENILFLGEITKWTQQQMAVGHIKEIIGEKGYLIPERVSLLLENGIDDEPFPYEATKNLPSNTAAIIEQELPKRKDLRTECIFTIDPSDAKDLDDAVSCVFNGKTYKVGVHIADVAYFVNINSPLDNIAAERCTSYYLSERVIPMLPPVLSENLCSLDSGADKLAFSIEWEMDTDGQILKQQIYKSVIMSACKLSYEHAQEMLQHPVDELRARNFPPIYGYSGFSQIYQAVNDLNHLAMKLREKRKNNGMLRLDQNKLCFKIDRESQCPTMVYAYNIKDSNRLIEEFMILANISVAKEIHENYSNLSILRNHLKPHEKPLSNVQQNLFKHNIYLNIESSKELANSLNKYKGDNDGNNARYLAVVNLLSKTMQLATYFCSGVSDESFHHYALCESIYTHFTSPIRRYADIMVHRLLAAKYHNEELPELCPINLHQIAQRCNYKKKMSKTVQDASAELYLAEYIRLNGDMREEGIVLGVLNQAFDVLIFRLGIVKRCYIYKVKDIKFQFYKQPIENVDVMWKDGTVFNAHMFQTANFLLSLAKDSLNVVINLIKTDSTDE